MKNYQKSLIIFINLFFLIYLRTIWASSVAPLHSKSYKWLEWRDTDPLKPVAWFLPPLIRGSIIDPFSDEPEAHATLWSSLWYKKLRASGLLGESTPWVLGQVNRDGIMLITPLGWRQELHPSLRWCFHREVCYTTAQILPSLPRLRSGNDSTLAIGWNRGWPFRLSEN